MAVLLVGCAGPGLEVTDTSSSGLHIYFPEKDRGLAESTAIGHCLKFDARALWVAEGTALDGRVSAHWICTR
jgi:hypothetical protein